MNDVEIAELLEEIATDDRLLEQWEKFKKELLGLLGECPEHGPCNPHVIERVKEILAENAHLKTMLALRTRREILVERVRCASVARLRQRHHDDYCPPGCKCADGSHIAMEILQEPKGEVV